MKAIFSGIIVASLMLMGAQRVPGVGGTVPSAAAITLDKNATGTACSGGPCTTATVTLTGQAASSGVLVGMLWCNNSSCTTTPGANQVTSVGDGVDSNLALLSGGTSSITLGTQSLALYAGTTSAGGTLTYTITFNTTVYYVTAVADSWLNLVPATKIDANGVGVLQFATCSSCPTGIATSGNISQNNEFVYSLAKSDGSMTAGAGFTIINNPKPNDEYGFTGSAGSPVTATWTSATTDFGGIVAAFKP